MAELKSELAESLLLKKNCTERRETSAAIRNREKTRIDIAHLTILLHNHNNYDAAEKATCKHGYMTVRMQCTYDRTRR